MMSPKNRVKIIKECSAPRHEEIEKEFASLCKKANPGQALNKFADLIYNEGRLAVTLHHDRIELFLDNGHLPTNREAADMYCNKHGGDSGTYRRYISGRFAKAREIFDTHCEQAEEFRYLMLVLSNITYIIKKVTKEFGHWYCETKKSYNKLLFKENTRFLSHNSIHPKYGYVHEFTKGVIELDSNKLEEESGCYKCIHWLTSIRVRDKLNYTNEKEWGKLLLEDVEVNKKKVLDFIEAITTEKISLSKFIVFVKKKDFKEYCSGPIEVSDKIWASNQQKFALWYRDIVYRLEEKTLVRVKDYD